MQEMITEGKNVVPHSSSSGKLLRVDAPFDTEQDVGGAIAHVPDRQKGDFMMPVISLFRRGVKGVIYNHAANDHGPVAANELRLPFLKGVNTDAVESATGSIVTIDGNRLFRGNGKFRKEEIDQEGLQLHPRQRVKVSIGFAEAMRQEVPLPEVTDGVGFLRMELLMYWLTGNKHPESVLEERGWDVMVNALKQELEKIVRPFAERNLPVWIRTDDCSGNDLYTLEDGSHREVPDADPALGFRGPSRYRERPTLLRWQMHALKNLLEDRSYENIGLFPPMIRLLEEYEQWKTACSRELGHESEHVRYGVMIETPAAVALAETKRFQSMIEFVVYGTNDLTQLSAGASRGDPRQSYVFDRAPEILRGILPPSIARLSQQNIETYVSGIALNDPAFLQELQDAGMSGISVAPNLRTIAENKRKLAEVQ